MDQAHVPSAHGGSEGVLEMDFFLELGDGECECMSMSMSSILGDGEGGGGGGGVQEGGFEADYYLVGWVRVCFLFHFVLFAVCCLICY